jgi:hypothetical protein
MKGTERSDIEKESDCRDGISAIQQYTQLLVSVCVPVPSLDSCACFWLVLMPFLLTCAHSSVCKLALLFEEKCNSQAYSATQFLLSIAVGASGTIVSLQCARRCSCL